MAMVQVVALIEDEARVEIEATAVYSRKKADEAGTFVVLSRYVRGKAEGARTTMGSGDHALSRPNCSFQRSSRREELVLCLSPPALGTFLADTRRTP